MRIIDGIDVKRISRKPDKTMILISSGSFVEQGVIIKKIELKLFVEKTDPKLGDYSLITSLVETDKGDVEMIYDEGYRGERPLESMSDFITNNLGLSSIILRSIIALKSNED